MESDGRSEGGIGTPADHDDAFRTMDEMRETLRRLTDQAKLQNAKLRAAVEWEGLPDEETEPPPKPGDAGNP
jgi:hypothetical protein